MTIVDQLDVPAGWQVRRFDRLFIRRKVTGQPGLEPLSVFLDVGVVPRSERSDNRNELGEDLSKYLVVEPNNLVFNKLRTWQGGYGRSRCHGIVSPAYFVCQPSADVDSSFIDYLLHSVPYRAELTRISKWQPPSQFDIPWEQLRLLPILLPPPQRQHAIADFLDRECARLDAVLKGLGLQIGRLDELRQNIVREAVDSLDARPLRHGFAVVDCKHRTPVYALTGYPVISTREVKRGVLDLSRIDRFVDASDYEDMRAGGRDPRPGDIIYSRNASLGIAAYVSNPVEVCMGQDVVLITRRPRDSELLTYVLNYTIADQVASLSVGSTFSRINVPVIRSLVIPYGRPDVEKRAVTAIRERFSVLDAAERELGSLASQLAEYRAALITEAVTGQLDVVHMSDAHMDESLDGAHMDESLDAARHGERPEAIA